MVTKKRGLPKGRTNNPNGAPKKAPEAKVKTRVLYRRIDVGIFEAVAGVVDEMIRKFKEGKA